MATRTAKQGRAKRKRQRDKKHAIPREERRQKGKAYGGRASAFEPRPPTGGRVRRAHGGVPRERGSGVSISPTRGSCDTAWVAGREGIPRILAARLLVWWGARVWRGAGVLLLRSAEAPGGSRAARGGGVIGLPGALAALPPVRRRARACGGNRAPGRCGWGSGAEALLSGFPGALTARPPVW